MSPIMPATVDDVNDGADRTASPDRDDLLEAIHAVMHQFRTQQYQALRDSPHDLTHMEGKALGYFARHPGSTLSDLVAYSGRDKGQIARLIGGLRSQGLLDAQPDPHDRRTTRLHLTQSGHEVFQFLDSEAQRLSTLASQGFSPQERMQLNDLLNRVKANLDSATR